MSNLVSAQYNM